MRENIKFDKSIPPGARLYFLELESNKDARVWSNATIAKTFGVSTATVSMWVKCLEDSGYIEREMVYREGTDSIDHRKIRLI